MGGSAYLLYRSLSSMYIYIYLKGIRIFIYIKSHALGIVIGFLFVAQVSHEKFPCIGDYTTQLYRDYNERF